MKAAVRREAPAIAAVVVAVLAVLAPLTLGGRLASSADTDAFYAPFATFLHDRLAAGDLPYWAPGAFWASPSWRMRSRASRTRRCCSPPGCSLDRAARRGDVPLPDRRARHHALARQLRASRTGSAFAAIAFAASGHLVARSAALGLLGGAAWLAPALALAEATATARPARRGFATAGLALVLALHLASGSQQLAARSLAACVLWLVARAGGRGLGRAAVAVALAFGLAAVALLPRLEFLREATASGYVDPDGIGSLLFGDRRGLVGRFGVSHSEIATLYLGAATPALAVLGLRRGSRDGRPVRLLAWLIAFSVAWASGLIGWLMDSLPLVRTVTGHEPVRGIVLALLCVSILAAFALPDPRRWPAAVSVALLGLGIGVLAGGSDGLALSYLIPLAAVCAVLALRRFPLAPLALLAVLAGDLAWQATHQDQRLHWLTASQVAPSRRKRRIPARGSVPRAVPLRHGGAESRAGRTSSGRTARRRRALLLDQEGLRLRLEDVAGYNPVHLKSYNRLMLASNGGVAVDRHFELALRHATPQLRSLAVRYYVSPPGSAPQGLPVVYRDRLSVVTRDSGALPFARIVRPGGAPIAARVVSREPDRVVIAPPAAGRLVIADLGYPGWRVTIDGARAKSLEDGSLRAVQVPAGARLVTWEFTPPGVRLGWLISLASAIALAGVAFLPWIRSRQTGGSTRA